MSDFLADLETELRAAARRRAARRRPRVPVVLRRALPALAVLAVLAAALAIVLRGAPAPDDVATTADPAAVTTIPRAAELATGCAGSRREARVIATPTVLRELLGVLRRPGAEPDGLPAAARAPGAGWVPLAAWARDGVRRAGRDRLATELHLIPGTGAARTGRPDCDGGPGDGRPALCLAAGTAGSRLAVACFTPEEIRDGAAIAITGAASGPAGPLAHGVVPDGVEAVAIEAAGRTLRAEVAENAYEARLPGLRAREPVTLRFERASSCGAEPDPRLLNAVAALRRPPAPGASVPRDALAALPGTPSEAAARIAGGGDEIAYWVVPVAERAAAPCALADLACVVPVRGDRAAGAPICDGAEAIAKHGAFIAGPHEDRVLVYGLAPAGAARLLVRLDGRPAGGVDVVDGVAAGLLRKGIRWRDGADVGFVTEPAEREEGTVALLNGTTQAGLGATAQGELVERVPELLPAGGTVVGNTTSQHLARSEVIHLAGREAEAYPIGAALGITRVREVTREELTDAGAPGSAVIAVLLGHDSEGRMR